MDNTPENTAAIEATSVIDVWLIGGRIIWPEIEMHTLKPRLHGRGGPKSNMLNLRERKTHSRQKLLDTRWRNIVKKAIQC